MRWLLVTANVVPSLPILITLMMEVLHSSKTLISHGVTSQIMALFKKHHEITFLFFSDVIHCGMADVA
jgi:hypothetical protein